MTGVQEYLSTKQH